MAEIHFSLIGALTPTLETIFHQFETQEHHQVKVETIPWEEAWQQILNWALHENSPHVSHVGSTWATSLFRMNALRPFTLTEIRAMGSQIAFLPQAFQSTQFGGPETFAMPWGTYTFVLAYRKDWLHQAGIEEKTAFSTFDALANTLKQLRASGIKTPWVVPVSPDHLDTLHYLASWVWGAGGDFIAPDGRRAAFNEPKTLRAIIQFFELMQYMKRVPLPLDEDSALGMFVQGEAAVTIVGCGIPYTWFSSQLVSPELQQNLGFAPMPGVPWIGGDHLVVWKQARMSPDIERASVDLVRYLLSQPVQEANAQGDDVRFPSRPDSFRAIPYQGSALTTSILDSLRSGYSYRPIPYWSKIEHQFARAFGDIADNIFKGTSPANAVQARLETLATWFNAMLR